MSRRWSRLLWSLVPLLALLAFAGAAMLMLTTTDRGSAWLLGRVPGLTLTQPQGRLFGGPFSAQRVELALATRRVQIERLSWADAQWAWRPHDGAWFGLTIRGARAERVNIDAGASSGPAREPSTLRLPFALALDELQVAQLQLDGAGVASDLAARVELGHHGGSLHRVPQWRARTARALASGRAQIGADAPFALDAQLRADALDGADPRWNATLDAQGPLAAIALRAQLSSPDAQGARADAQATLAPFAAWPLSTLQATLQDLNLAALFDAAPRTRLSGRASIDTRGRDQPVAAQLSLANAEPGRWDQQRLPLATLELDLAGRADQRQRLAIRRFELGLPGNAGRIGGQGEWSADAATLDVTLQAVRPSALDARAPAMTLGGTLALRLAGLPAPDGSTPAAAAQRLQSTLALDGRLDARRGEPVRVRGTLKAERSGALWRAELDAIDATAGTAQLRGRLSAAREAALWRLASQGDAARFDPAAWWRDAPPAQLNGRWNAELSAPPTLAFPLRDVSAWQALRGQARVELQDSSVAGVPLQGVLSADGRQPGWSIDADARAAGNRVAAQGRLAPRAADDRWRAEIDAPALAALRPLIAALAPKSGLGGLDGVLSGQAQTQGRWPALQSSGNLRGSALRAGAWSAQRVAAAWQAGPDRNAPLALTLEADRASDGTLTLDSLRGSVDGTLAAHRIALDGLTPLRPPAWTDTLLGAAAGRVAGSRMLLRADGRWLPGTNIGAPLAGQWQARVSALDARGRDAGVPWLAAKDLALELQLDAQARPLQARLASGSAQVLGASLVLREARWQAGANAPFALDADLEPLAIAPLLARWQPAAGFGGDLRIKGRAQVRRSDAFAADLVFERADGDLAITTDGVTQPLGLTDLRLALAAERGTWHFTQALAGANLGVLVGAQSMRLDPAATWPAPSTPMQGVLEWQVADLGVWAPLTPPGWRVAGRLRTSAAIGGRFGAPEIEGRMEGSGLALRNLLLGVDLRDGDLALSLRGDDARIERFVFKGGDGELRVSGGATLGADPRARLQLNAERFRLLGRTDRRIVASGQATLALDAKSLALDGRLGIDEGLIDVSRGDAPSLDADVTVRGGRNGARAAGVAPAEPTAPTPRAPAAARDVRVAVQLDLGQQLRLRGRGLDTRLAGRLAISAPGGRLALGGDISTADGTYAAYGQKLEIERGVLRFVGEAENPRLDILAVRPNLDVTVGVLVTGTAQSPRVRLISEPEMSDYDKLSWLVLGRASDGLARTDTALLQRAALALLAGEGQGADAALIANLGLDELSLRQNEVGDVRETVVTLGKQLSRRWYVGYERSVNNTTGTWQLIYRAAQRFTLRAQSGAENSLDAIWVWRWN